MPTSSKDSQIDNPSQDVDALFDKPDFFGNLEDLGETLQSQNDDADSSHQPLVTPTLQETTRGPDDLKTSPHGSTTSIETIYNPSVQNETHRRPNNQVVRRSQPPYNYYRHDPASHINIQSDDNNAVGSSDLYSAKIFRDMQPMNSSLHSPAPLTSAVATAPPYVKKLPPYKTRPAFVNKIWSMINDKSNSELIQWAPDGKSFVVMNRERFVHEVLPKYFKHSNFASFVRQLNMYGWHKVQDVKSGSIQNSSDDKWQFENEYFRREREDLLENIVRQKSQQSSLKNMTSASGYIGMDNAINNGNPGSASPPPHRTALRLMNESSMGNQVDLYSILNEIEQIKYNQMAISKDLIRINKDNELLWKENMMARDRHRKQQQVLEKIFRFLTSLAPHIDQRMIMDSIMGSSHAGNNATNSAAPLNQNDALFNLSTEGASPLHGGTGPADIDATETMMNDHFNNMLDSDLGVGHNPPIDPKSALGHAPEDEPLGRPRYLLKNRAHSTSSSDKPVVSPKNIDLHQSLSSGRISEIPFEDDDEADTSANTHEPRAPHMFLNDLQSDLEHQDDRIQHLEDLVNVFTPTESPNFDLRDYLGSDKRDEPPAKRPRTES